MKRRFGCAALLFLVLLPSLALAAPQRHRLPSGLTVIISENHEAPVVSFQVWARAGSAYERLGEYGITHLIEHMIFKGSPRHPAGEMARRIEALGGEVNAYTTLDHTNYHVTAASRHAGLALELLADAVVNASFGEADLAREKEVVAEEIRMNQDSPDRRRGQEVLGLAFGDHPYGRPVIGTPESVRGISRQVILDYRARWYRAANLVVVAVGDLRAAETLALIEKAFAGLPQEPAPAFDLPPVKVPQGPRLKIMRDKVKQAAVSLSWPIPGLPSDEVYALDVAASVAGEGKTSRLWSRVKEKLGLVDGVEASAYTPAQVGLFQVEARLAPEKVTQAWPALLEQALSLAAQPPTPAEMERARVNNQADFVRSRQTMQGQARMLGYFELLRGGYQKAQEYLERYRAVSAEQVAAGVHAYLRPEGLSVVIQLPEGAEAPDEAQLAAQAREAFARLSPPPPPSATGAQRIQLDCGLTLIVKPRRDVPLVSLVLAAPGGQVSEGPAEAGLHQLWSKAITRGSRAHSHEELAALLEDRAAGLHGFASRSTAGLVGSFLAQDWRLGLSLLTETWRHPTFPADQVQKAKEDQLARLRSQEDQPTARAFKLFRRLLYGDTPYGLDPLGTPQSLAHLDRQALIKAHQRLAGPQGLVLSVVGDVEPETVRGELERLWAGALGRAEAPVPPPLNGAAGPRAERVKEAKAAQTQILLGYLAPSAVDPRRFAMQLWEAVLGGQGGRLFSDLRDRQSLAYGVQPFYSSAWHSGSFGVYMGVGPGKEATALKGLMAHLERARREPPSPEELERAKGYLLGSQAIDLQGYEAQATAMAVDELMGLGFDHYLKVPALVQAVTPADMRQVAQEVLGPARQVELTLGP
ncbi:MAG: insulinase family protein [Desulfarculus sp.]|nr:insulinase family protein [Desulfarculus sp.]